MDNTLGYELSNGGSIPSGRTTNNIKYIMFAKLNKSFKIDDCTIGDELISYGPYIKYNDIQHINVNKLYEVIPEMYRRFFDHKFMTITEDIVPHKDNGTLASINFYMKANSGLTKFFEFTTDNPNIHKLDNQGNGANYQSNQLKLRKVFVAQDYDAYLLDVTLPHAVEFKAPRPILRTALVLQTATFNFQQVFKMLEETGNI